MRIRRFFGFIAAGLLAGCGGNVLVEGDGPGGHGGGGAGGHGGGGAGGDTTGTTGTTTTTDTTTVPPGEVTPACLDYCATISDKGCFETQDCHARCMALYVEGCTAEVETTLACLPDWLSDVCQIGYPNDPNGGCYNETDDLWSCGAEMLSGCWSFASELVGDSGCTGDASCPGFQLGIACDQSGQCACLKDGVTVGGCSMPFAGSEACSPPFSCCRPFFGI